MVLRFLIFWLLANRSRLDFSDNSYGSSKGGCRGLALFILAMIILIVFIILVALFLSSVNKEI